MLALGAIELLIIVFILLATVPGLIFQPRLLFALLGMLAAPLVLGTSATTLSSNAQVDVPAGPVLAPIQAQRGDSVGNV